MKVVTGIPPIRYRSIQHLLIETHLNLALIGLNPKYSFLIGLEVKPGESQPFLVSSLNAFQFLEPRRTENQPPVTMMKPVSIKDFTDLATFNYQVI